MGFWRRRLTAKLLFLFVLLAIVPLVVVGYMSYDTGRQSILRNVEAHLESVAILKQHGIHAWVEHLAHSLTWLATSPQITDGAAVLATHEADDPAYRAAHESIVVELRRMATLGHLSPLSLVERNA